MVANQTRWIILVGILSAFISCDAIRKDAKNNPEPNYNPYVLKPGRSFKAEPKVINRLDLPEPAASVRLLVPWAGEPFELPTWNGNEFLLADGRRPALRTFTPVSLADGELTIDVVRHPGGAISDWAETAASGEPCAVSGPGRGEVIDPQAGRYVLLGDAALDNRLALDEARALIVGGE